MRYTESDDVKGSEFSSENEKYDFNYCTLKLKYSILADLHYYHYFLSDAKIIKIY